VQWPAAVYMTNRVKSICHPCHKKSGIDCQKKVSLSLYCYWTVIKYIYD